ncbi:hypothetical protein [Planctomycetes bacterium K23_9]|uniref:DUF4440 domain-containing protein n=1 Tax=Stieleria marina TaxID=1930275 RepID=A0A517NY51_9BACT|nr:hypothetical protein K239x_40480 [Planctomycetes bacterium K23_9]
MTILAEHPLLLSLMVGMLAGGTLYAWLQSGKKSLAIAGFAFLALIPIIWLIATELETDREHIERLVYETAQAVQDNDHVRAVLVIGDEDTKRKALAELPKYEFDRVKASSITIDFVPGSNPPLADVDLIASVVASDKAGRFQNMRVPRKILLTFEKTGDQWKVIDYNHMQIGGQADAFSPPTISGQRSN